MTEFANQLPVTGPMAPAENPAILRQPLGRRGFLIAMGLGGLMTAAGCTEHAENGYYPDGGFTASPTTPGEPGATATPYETTSPTIAPTETVGPTSTTDTAPAVGSTTTENNPNRAKAKIEGYKLPVKWGKWDNAKLADAVRKRGQDVPSDPSVAGLDEDYYRKAVVLGMPQKPAKGRKLGIALVSTTDGQDYSDGVYHATLPKGTARHNGQALRQLPEAVSSVAGQVHPYRMRMSPTEVTVMFYTTNSKGGDLKLIEPQVLNPGVDLANGTYANAHVI